MAYQLVWRKLLSANRPSRPNAKKNVDRPYIAEDERTPFEQDYDRIIFSSPFRRLARKTQVHPLVRNDHIHNRMTHSLEVATVGRSFARKLAKIAFERSDLDEGKETELTWILQSSCLIHDLGNPPFGHAGEEVVRAWAKNHQDEMFDSKRFDNKEDLESCKADWFNFEGNAQGFRLAARADNPDAGYLRLTHATLAAAIKYPWAADDVRVKPKSKHNVYTTEKALFRHMAEDLGLIVDDAICRHPLSFLTEAADDICYRIMDLEDAVEMGLQGEETVRKLFLEITGRPNYGWMKLSQLRGQTIKALMNKFWRVFEEDFDRIMNGERINDLKASLDDSTKRQMTEVDNAYAAIFGHSKKVALELGAYHILGRVLKALMKTVNWICDSDKYEDVPFLSKRCAELAWGRNYAANNFEQSHIWWMARMNDFVSGMTDDFATALSGEIGGHTYSNH